MVKRGGELSVGNFKSMIKSTYKKPSEYIDGYVLDKSISNKTGKVYYNPDTNHAVVSHRGTKGVIDWANNIDYLGGDYEKTDRFKRGMRTQEAVYSKYGADNTSTIGHSQGSVLAHKLGADSREIIQLNPASMGEARKKNEFVVKSNGDIISAFVRPNDRDTILKYKKPYNLINEHSTNILDRLPQDQMLGQGLRKTNPWVEHIKKYATTHGMSYWQALKTPQCKNSYKKN